MQCSAILPHHPFQPPPPTAAYVDRGNVDKLSQCCAYTTILVLVLLVLVLQQVLTEEMLSVVLECSEIYECSACARLWLWFSVECLQTLLITSNNLLAPCELWRQSSVCFCIVSAKLLVYCGRLTAYLRVYCGLLSISKKMPSKRKLHLKRLLGLKSQRKTNIHPQISIPEDDGRLAEEDHFDPQPSTSTEHIPHTPQTTEDEIEPQPSTSRFEATSFYGTAKPYLPRWATAYDSSESDDEWEETPTPLEEPSQSTDNLFHEPSQSTDNLFHDTCEEQQQLVEDEEPQDLNNEPAVRNRPPRSTRDQRRELVNQNDSFQEFSANRNRRDSGPGVGIYNNSHLVRNIESFCPTCDECGDILEIETKSNDLDFYVQGKCPGCGSVKGEPSHGLADKNNICASTTGIVNHLMDTGKGYADLCKLTSSMNIGSGMNKRRYYEYHNAICDATTEMSNDLESVAVECVTSHYENNLGIRPGDDGVLDVDVSFDGTWMTRGHKSQLSAGFVIEADTQIVVDHEVLSKYCYTCTKLSNKYKHNEDLLEEKMQEHKNSGNCEQNYEGTSGGMEKQMAINMWNRSQDKNAMRYTTMISDGDTATYAALCENVDYHVEKEECINHVSKRLGTRLRKLKQEHVVEKTTKTGRTIRQSVLGGKNKLTDSAIDHMSRYYSKAVRDNVGGTVEGMRNACLSGFQHVTSSDDCPSHENCEEGEDSWCFYNKAQAKGEEPPSHDTMKLRVVLNEEEKELVGGVYESLTRDELMSRCMKGRTQNANESLHSKIWNKKSKSKFCGLHSLKQAAASTVMEHNYGLEASNVVANMPFPDSEPSKSQRQANKARESWTKRMSMSSKKKRNKERNVTQQPAPDGDYDPGQF